MSKRILAAFIVGLIVGAVVVWALPKEPPKEIGRYQMMKWSGPFVVGSTRLPAD